MEDDLQTRAIPFFSYPAHVSWFKHLPWYRKKLPQHIWKKLKRWLSGLHNSTRPAPGMGSPWGAHTSTQCQHKHFLARWFCLSSLVMLRAPEGGHQIVSGIKKKRCWPSAKLATLSRQRISGYWVDPCCVSLPGENDLLYCLPSAVDQGQECGGNAERLLHVVANVLMACDH